MQRAVLGGHVQAVASQDRGGNDLFLEVDAPFLGDHTTIKAQAGHSAVVADHVGGRAIHDRRGVERGGCL